MVFNVENKMFRLLKTVFASRRGGGCPDCRHFKVLQGEERKREIVGWSRVTGGAGRHSKLIENG